MRISESSKTLQPELSLTDDGQQAFRYNLKLSLSMCCEHLYMYIGLGKHSGGLLYVSYFLPTELFSIILNHSKSQIMIIASNITPQPWSTIYYPAMPCSIHSALISYQYRQINLVSTCVNSKLTQTACEGSPHQCLTFFQNILMHTTPCK